MLSSFSSELPWNAITAKPLSLVIMCGFVEVLSFGSSFHLDTPYKHPANKYYEVFWVSQTCHYYFLSRDWVRGLSFGNALERKVQILHVCFEMHLPVTMKQEWFHI